MPESSPLCTSPAMGYSRSGGRDKSVQKTAFHADFIRTFQQGATPRPVPPKEPSEDVAAKLRNSPVQKVRHEMKSRLPPLPKKSSESSIEDHELSELNPVHETQIMPQISNPIPQLNKEILNSPLTSGNRAVTLTGTIKRGKKSEVVEVQLQLSEEELNKLNQSILEDEKKKDSTCICGLKKGLHIVLLSVLFIPFSFLSSISMSFYVGTMGWYNLYLYLSEECTIWHKIFLCPLLILGFPFLIGISALGIAIYAVGAQISWYFSSWHRQISDFEKGFYGWVFNKIGVPECAPYEIVILDDPVPGSGVTSSTSQV